MNKLMAGIVALLAGVSVVFGISDTNRLATGVTSATSNITVGAVRITPTNIQVNGSVVAPLYYSNTTAGAGLITKTGDLITVGTNVTALAVDWAGNPSNSVLQSAIDGKAATNANLSGFNNDSLFVTKGVTNDIGGLIESARTNAIATNATSSAGVTSNAVNQIVSGTNNTTLAIVAGKVGTNSTMDLLFRADGVTLTNVLHAADTNNLQRADAANTNNLTTAQANVLFIPLTTNLPTQVQVTGLSNTLVVATEQARTNAIATNLTGLVSGSFVTNNFLVASGTNGSISGVVTGLNSIALFGTTGRLTGNVAYAAGVVTLTNTSGSVAGTIVGTSPGSAFGIGTGAAGTPGQFQYNSAGVFAGADLVITNTSSASPPGFWINHLLSWTNTYGAASGNIRMPLVITSTNSASIGMYAYRNDANGAGQVFAKARGTANAPLPPNNNDQLANVGVGGWQGTNWALAKGAYIIYAAENWGNGTNGTYHLWSGTPRFGSSTAAEWMRLMDASLLIGAVTTNGNLLRVAGAIESTALNSSGAAWVNPNGTYSAAVGYKTNVTLTANLAGAGSAVWGAIYYAPFTVNGAVGNLVTNQAGGICHTFITNQVTVWFAPSSNTTSLVSENIW